MPVENHGWSLVRGPWSVGGRRSICAARTTMPDEQDSNAIKLGQRVREARDYLGLSMEQLAEYLGISRAALAAIEAGRRRVSPDEIERLASLLKQPVSFFRGEVDALVDEAPDETVRALFRAARELS